MEYIIPRDIPDLTAPEFDSDRARVMARVTIDADTGCWIANKSPKAHYSTIGWQGSRYALHRLSYSLWVGAIPHGLVIDHLCRVKTCCNPKHLEPVTLMQNSLRSSGGTETHCPAGHPRTPDISVFSPVNGARRCLLCAPIHLANYKKRYAAQSKLIDEFRESKGISKGQYYHFEQSDLDAFAQLPRRAGRPARTQKG